ncbi:MAG: TIGR02757 family protein [Sulfuricurvum sp. RIFCSPLOWO2_12_43_5]|nr:MAG: TIGR02757 family protein [Sulfuricurvum sp. RIFCSPLOWO2_12_43_5]
MCEARPDPLMIARRTMDQHHALTCALFAYGSAKAIVAFLATLEEDLVDLAESDLRFKLEGKYYRFQSSEDIIQWFCTLGRLKASGGAEKAFKDGYSSDGLIGGVSTLITSLYDLNPYRSKGYEFLIGKPIVSITKASAMKRWMMYLRWMVRKNELDMGLWSGVSMSDLIMPLDTHTFNVSHRLGLLTRSVCDMRSAIELTERLKKFDPHDPLKYDFALYRIGQEKLL